MSEELKPEELQEQVDQLSEERTGKLTLLDEQITQELVKANVTEAVIASLRDKYGGLKIADVNDKETYLIVKEGRKECKSIRVIASKICKKLREDAVAIQKASVAKEKYVTGSIAEIEDALQEQEDWYESEVAKEKEARKRKQEEQLIVRQQTLTNMGALYSDGSFTLGEVSFELSLIKESENDIWEDTILPKFKEEYEKVQAEYIEQQRKEQEKADELKRQQEELEAERKRLSAEADRLKAEKDRQELEAAKRRSDQFEFRSQQLKSIGFEVHGVEWYVFREFKIAMAAVWDWDDNAWGLQLVSAKQYVDQVLVEEAEEKRKEQERKDLQDKRYAEMYPYKEFGSSVQAEALWCLSEDEYSSILLVKKSAYEHAEEEKKQKIADDAAKKERERIEEEQRQAEVKRKRGLREFRISALAQYNTLHTDEMGDLGEMSDDKWMILITMTKQMFDDLKRKQEEERKAEELAQASDKTKWADMMKYLQEIYIHDFKSGPYRKRAAILREKLEEIKAL